MVQPSASPSPQPPAKPPTSSGGPSSGGPSASAPAAKSGPSGNSASRPSPAPSPQSAPGGRTTAPTPSSTGSPRSATQSGPSNSSPDNGSTRTTSGPGSPTNSPSNAPSPGTNTVSRTQQTQGPGGTNPPRGTESTSNTSRTSPEGNPGNSTKETAGSTTGQEALAAQNKARIDLQQQRAQEQTRRQTAENLRTATTGNSITNGASSTPERTSGSTTKSSSTTTSSTGSSLSSDADSSDVDPNSGARVRGAKSANGSEDSQDGSGNDGNQNQDGQPKVDPKNGVQIAGVGDDATRAALAELKSRREETSLTSTGRTELASIDYQKLTLPKTSDKPIQNSTAETDAARAASDRVKAAEKQGQALGITLTGKEDPETAEKSVKDEITRLTKPADSAPSGDNTREKVTNRINALQSPIATNADRTPGTNDVAQVEKDLASGKLKEIPLAGSNAAFDVAAVLGVRNALTLGTPGGPNTENLRLANQRAVAQLNGYSQEQISGLTADQLATLNRQRSDSYLRSQGVNLSANATYADMLKGYVDVLNKQQSASTQLATNATWSQVMEVWKQQNAMNSTIQARATAAGLSLNTTAAGYEQYFRTISGLEGYKIPQKAAAPGVAPPEPQGGKDNDPLPRNPGPVRFASDNTTRGISQDGPIGFRPQISLSSSGRPTTQDNATNVTTSSDETSPIVGSPQGIKPKVAVVDVDRENTILVDADDKADLTHGRLVELTLKDALGSNADKVEILPVRLSSQKANVAAAEITKLAEGSVRLDAVNLSQSIEVPLSLLQEGLNMNDLTTQNLAAKRADVLDGLRKLAATPEGSGTANEERLAAYWQSADMIIQAMNKFNSQTAVFIGAGNRGAESINLLGLTDRPNTFVVGANNTTGKPIADFSTTSLNNRTALGVNAFTPIYAADKTTLIGVDVTGDNKPDITPQEVTGSSFVPGRTIDGTSYATPRALAEYLNALLKTGP